jgi:hypothetical protein
VGVVELYLYFDPSLLSISNYNPVGRWSEAIIDPSSMIDNESGTYIISYNFATGIQAGTGPIFTFDMHNFATDMLKQNSSVLWVLEILEVTQLTVPPMVGLSPY